ncbi:MAG: C39 family peptidase [Actinomycetota bacterium]
MSRSAWKRVVPWLLAGVFLLATPIEAFAAFSLSDVPHLLPGGAALGTVSNVHGSTNDHDGTGPCATTAFPSGYPHASLYRVTTAVRSYLSLDAGDDIGNGASLCRVSVYAASSESDPFNAADRTARLVAENDDCASSSDCSVETWLSAGRTYLVVLWATPPASGPGREASFDFDASVKEPPAMSVGVSGHRIREGCYGYHEVIVGRKITITAAASLDETVTFVREQLVSGNWTEVETDEHELTGGRASLTLPAAANGRWRVSVLVPGTSTRLHGRFPVLLHYLTPRWFRYYDGGVRLSVRYYHQQYRLSCELAALRMAHNYHDPGHITGDAQVVRVVGIDKRRPRNGRWGNPNRVFVGYLNGRMMTSGYGVHAAPIARAATVFDRCRPSVRLSRYSRQTLAMHLNNGYPVIVWGAHAGPSGIRRVHWRAWDGASITAYSVEHTWVVIGFRGPVSSPTKFIIHDPSGRSTRTIAASQLYAFTKYFRTGVVVRG